MLACIWECSSGECWEAERLGSWEGTEVDLTSHDNELTRLTARDIPIFLIGQKILLSGMWHAKKQILLFNYRNSYKFNTIQKFVLPPNIHNFINKIKWNNLGLENVMTIPKYCWPTQLPLAQRYTRALKWNRRFTKISQDSPPLWLPRNPKQLRRPYHFINLPSKFMPDRSATCNIP